MTYVRFEEQYLSNVKNIIENGCRIDNDRTGVGTMMLPGISYRVDLTKEFPALTTKWVGIKDAFKELMWMISGDTSETNLRESGCTIWKEWASKDGQLGPIYPAMWRRRPAASINYAMIPPNFAEDENYVNTHVVMEKHQKLVDLALNHIPYEIPVENPIERRYVELIALVVRDRLKLQRSWLTFEGFSKDFFKLPGSEFAVVDKSFKPYIFHKNTNKVGPTTLEYIDSAHSHKAYSCSQDREVPARMPVFYIDQLGSVVEALKGPGDRRMVVDSWEPSILPDPKLKPHEQPLVGLQALACCHCMYQFHKHPPKEPGGKHRISITVTQRSQDTACGAPYNAASYALLLMMVSHVVDCEPWILTLNVGDAHVYTNHIETLLYQATRPILPAPTVRIKEGVKHSRLEYFTFDDFEVIRYGESEKIRYEVAV